MQGPAAGSTIAALTGRHKPPAPRVATVRELRDPSSQQLLDVALVIYFQGPKSFTGEDRCVLLSSLSTPFPVALLLPFHTASLYYGRKPLPKHIQRRAARAWIACGGGGGVDESVTAASAPTSTTWRFYAPRPPQWFVAACSLTVCVCGLELDCMCMRVYFHLSGFRCMRDMHPSRISTDTQACAARGGRKARLQASGSILAPGSWLRIVQGLV